MTGSSSRIRTTALTERISMPSAKLAHVKESGQFTKALPSWKDYFFPVAHKFAGG